MGKGSAPAVPNYQPIASADAQTAQLSYNLGQQQLAWAKNQFNQTWPYAQNYLNASTNTMNAQAGAAQAAQNFYNTTYQPIETSFANEAQNYNSPARAAANAGNAMADVSNTMNQSRNAALSNLESYGVDPSQTRFGALDLGTRISQAAATAAAGTQSRLNTEATGLGLQGEAINIGRGYPSSISNSYATAMNAGSAGLSSANQTSAVGSNDMMASNGFLNTSLNANNDQVNTLNTGFNDAYDNAKLQTEQSASLIGGIGGLAGMALGGYMMNPASAL